MISKFLHSIKFFFSKINVYMRYKKKRIILGLKWIFTGKEISNFTYEINNINEILHTCQIITNAEIETLDQILNEINFENKDFRDFFSDEFYKDNNNKNIFGRRMLWYILARYLKPELIIESGMDSGLGSTLMIYAQYKNSQEQKKLNFEFIGIDILQKKNFIFNFENQNFLKYKFVFDDSLKFLSNFNSKKKIMYISDAEHNYEFELKEFDLIKKNLCNNSIIISDNNSGSLSKFSIQNKKKLVYFHEKSKNFWYGGAVSSVSYFY